MDKTILNLFIMSKRLFIKFLLMTLILSVVAIPGSSSNASQHSTIIEVRVSASSDDAEQRISGYVSLTSSDLELVFDGEGDQKVGMRFNGITIPRGATITKAWVQFQVDEVSTDPTSLFIQGEEADNAVTFSGSGDISSRDWTEASPAGAAVLRMSKHLSFRADTPSRRQD